ncbi:hypothetical protein ACFVAJ_13105 [Agromyces sp. NPDC057679]|uniref:hypothetical protein n=1 Tax=Agromyces sp. NPDC057679 TaxID=3346207 RepID=UPI0036712AA4
MSVIHDRADVARLLHDPAWLVPEAEPGATAFARLRSEASRFVNGPVHDERRSSIESRLAGLDPARLARDAGARARAARAEGRDAAEIARRIPVLALAAALDSDGASAPEDAATVAAPYAVGIVDDADAADVDTAAERLLGAVPAGRRAALDAQLLVQAHAATGGLIAAVLRRAAESPDTPTAQLIDDVLRHAPPVVATRRVAPPDGREAPGDDAADRLVELRLDGPDREATEASPPRVLAFGAGPRRCPASQHAVAIAAAVVDALREPTC